MYSLTLRALGVLAHVDRIATSGTKSSPAVMHIRYLLKPLDHLMNAASTVPFRHVAVVDLVSLIHGHVHTV